MPEGEDTGAAGSTTTATFSQADVDRIVRERLGRERDKFKDYDDLKTRAAEADQSKSALEKVLEKVSSLEERATKAERAALRADVATTKKLPAWMAKRLQGNTREELEADADEMLAEAKPGGSEGGEGKNGDATNGDAGDNGAKNDAGKEATGGNSGKGAGDGEGRKLPPSGRPKEKLTSGAVPATSGDKSPAELAESILKSDF
ncbi:MAG TPA: hypothetical protein VF062_23475 [Candidatus Limnocylindrales bacterium]